MALARILSGLHQPHGLPRDAWRSAQFQAAARSLDAYCLLLTTLNNLLVISIRFAKRASHIPTALAPNAAVVCGLPLLTITYGMVQQLACCAYPARYFRYRPYVLLGARLLRLFTFVEWTLQMRAWLTAPAPADHIAAFTSSSPQAPMLAGSLNTLLVFSGALHAIANNVTVPLPLIPQALFQLLYLVLMLKHHARVAAAGIDMSPFAGGVHDVCLTLNAVVAMSASAHAGHMINLQELQDTCRASSALLLVVFAQMYFGFVLPLYCTFRVEQEVRQHIRQALQHYERARGWHHYHYDQHRLHGSGLDQEQQQQHALGDVALLLMLAAICWLTAVNFLPELMQLSLPDLSRLQLWRAQPLR